ncbi:MAG: hypothetical protein BroJett011_35220 [Chloroflexota bacterium]|nr:MAG: hypothetical protein BroJett011_35220 [Chloroflexota bacterium]
MYEREAAAGLSQGPQQSKILTEADIAHLPPAVQRYMAFVGAIGKPRHGSKAQIVRLTL